MDLKIISNYYILVFTILSLQAYSIISYNILNYPYGLYLPNGNIFVIHQNGISIYDHLFTNKTKDVLTFSEKDKLKTSDLSRITTTFEDDLLFCLIKDKIYILNNKGNLLFHNNTSILIDEKQPDYYSLAAIKINNYLYNYSIFYFCNKTLYRAYYQYNINLNENILITSFSQNNFSYTQTIIVNFNEQIHVYTYDFYNDALTCQYMVDKNKNIILTCFLLIVQKFYVVFYHSQEKTLPYYSGLLPISNSYKDIECIKSVLISNRSKVFVGLYYFYGELKSFIFDINDKKNFTEFHFNQYFKNNYCMMN